MVRKSVSRLLTLSLLSCLALSVFGIDAGVLGISWNVQLATEPTDNPRHKHSWMSIVEFDKNVVDIFSDEEIVGLARRAFDDMKADYGRNDPPWKDPKNNIDADQPKDAPAAMSAIAIGQQLFLSSSVRGGGLGYTPSAFTKVREALIQCQMETGGNTKHLTLAGCGEPMAAHIALQSGLGSLNGAKVCNCAYFTADQHLTCVGCHMGRNEEEQEDNQDRCDEAVWPFRRERRCTGPLGL